MVDHRPVSHLRPQHGWTNDPVGPVRWRGRWHLFHQANPDGGYWARPHWGHFVSDDLARWEELDLALSPDDTGPDVDGAYSGCIVTDGDLAWLFYTGASGSPGPRQGQVTCVATSTDDDLSRWTKHPTPVTAAPPDLEVIGFRDPFVFRHEGRWLQLVGSGILDLGGAVLLYASDDLVAWRFLGPILVGDETTRDPLWTGSMWECPALLRFDATDVLLISVHDGADMHHPMWFEGRFDGRGYHPNRGHRVDLGPDLYAPCVLARDDGTYLLWGWSWEARDPEVQREQGWAGVLSLPRVVSHHDGRLHVSPEPGLTGLREPERRLTARATDDGWRAIGADGDRLEILARFPARSRRVGLRVRASPDRQEHTTIVVDRARGRLELDRDHASLDPTAAGGCYGGDLTLDDDEPVELRVFVDRSIVEVFANDRATLTARIYPTRTDSTGVEVIDDHPAAGVASTDHAATGVDEVSVWGLGPAIIDVRRSDR